MLIDDCNDGDLFVLTINPPLEDTNTSSGELRPVNLRTDLAQLADLIELSFRDTMDENGRAAIREMRYMSKMGMGLNILGRLNDLAVGISLGYVWVEDGRVVGNASIYPADWHKQLGAAWIIANVAVHPDHQRKGIARQLMQACLAAIRDKGGKHAILQVDYDNRAAIRLYNGLGFTKERPFTTWWRSAMATSPEPIRNDDLHITRPRRSEWQAELDLAQTVRPFERGGIGWMKPTHESLFRKTWWESLTGLLSMNNIERLIIRTDDKQQILATLWIESGLSLTRTRLTLMTQEGHIYPHAEVMLNSALRRYRTTAFTIEHPYDDKATTELFREYRFYPHRTVWHMRREL